MAAVWLVWWRGVWLWPSETVFINTAGGAVWARARLAVHDENARETMQAANVPVKMAAVLAALTACLSWRVVMAFAFRLLAVAVSVWQAGKSAFFGAFAVWVRGKAA